jgi:hypothetical protein
MCFQMVNLKSNFCLSFIIIFVAGGSLTATAFTKIYFVPHVQYMD